MPSQGSPGAPLGHYGAMGGFARTVINDERRGGGGGGGEGNSEGGTKEKLQKRQEGRDWVDKWGDGIGRLSGLGKKEKSKKRE